MIYFQKDLRNKIYNLLKEDYGINEEEILFSIPPDRKFGDLSTTIPFVLAKKERGNPFVIGNKILEKLKDKFEMFSEIKLAGGGFLNFYFRKDFLFRYLLENINRKIRERDSKVIVEHTSINPNKSAHIGHLRNSCLGDTLAKCLSFLGYEVEIQNYIDDTDIQIADVVWGLMNYQKKDLKEIKKIKNLASYLWDLYSNVHKLFESEEKLKDERNTIHKKIEEKENPEYEVSNYLSNEVLKDHIRVMDILGIQYDLLVKESDIIELDFFKDVKDILTKNDIMYLSQDPEKKGCWVIKYERENIEKIIIRSNNTVTYIGKDIAYTLWKTGLFKKDFFYRKFFTYRDNKDIYITDASFQKGVFNFGKASRVYNVIDVRQAYLQNTISQILDTLSSEKDDKKFTHFSYEMVALTPKCVKELGFDISEEDQKKSYVEVSGRKGIAVKADDLINKLVEKSLWEVKQRNPGISQKKAEGIAKDIAIGALRYFMIKFNLNSVIAFDFEDALAFEGDTGPYLQYTLVRINSILKKMGEKEYSIDSNSTDLTLLDKKEFDILYEILLNCSLLETQVELALNNNELSAITNFSNSLCQKFNHYYHIFPVISEKDVKIKKIRLNLILLVKNKLEKLLNIMGIPFPEKM